MIASIGKVLDEGVVPVINVALGVTIRGAGLTRTKGGMRGFWQWFVEHYRRLGGTLRVGCMVHQVEGRIRRFTILTQRGMFQARQVASTVPASLTARIAASFVGNGLDAYLQRDAGSLGGARVAFLGVPEVEVSGQEFTHHQLVQSYARFSTSFGIVASTHTVASLKPNDFGLFDMHAGVEVHLPHF
jgi:phytoene dehydrogenase-like protein